jgi:hypothetical protein
LDSGVLITAYNAAPELKEPALRMLEDPDRVFLCSPFVHLETTPSRLLKKTYRPQINADERG